MQGSITQTHNPDDQFKVMMHFGNELWEFKAVYELFKSVCITTNEAKASWPFCFNEHHQISIFFLVHYRFTRACRQQPALSDSLTQSALLSFSPLRFSQVSEHGNL